MFPEEVFSQNRSGRTPAYPHISDEDAVGTGWSLARLENEIAEQAAHISAATCRWLGLVAEFDRREGWKEMGHYCCSVWLAWRCGLTPRAAQEHVRVAHRLEELHAIRAAFGRGELTYTKVRALARVACAENEALLLQHARVATGAQLERICRAYRGATLREAGRARERRHFSYGWDDDDSFTFRGRLSGEEGALLLQALEAGFEAIRAENDSRESEVERPTNADAFVALAETALASDGASSSGGDRHQVVVHVDASTLAAEEGVEGPATLDGGHPIAAETVRRLACDASVVRILERDGEPLSVGRKTRTIPPALRRALNARDKTCRFPGCTNHRFTDAHHLRHWAHGGETSLDNLVRLCRFHHDLCHVGGFSVDRSASGEIVFRRPDGRVVPHVPPPCTHGSAGRVRARNRRAGLRIGPETGASLGRGESFSLDITVEGLCRKAPAAGARAP